MKQKKVSRLGGRLAHGAWYLRGLGKGDNWGVGEGEDNQKAHQQSKRMQAIEERSLDFDREHSQPRMSDSWMDMQGTPGPGQYESEKMPRMPVPAFTIPSSGRDTQAKMYIGRLHSQASGESISQGPAQYNCSHDFSTGLLEDVAKTRRESSGVMSRVKKGVSKGIGMPLSTR
jgi:hypothetical protein